MILIDLNIIEFFVAVSLMWFWKGVIENSFLGVSNESRRLYCASDDLVIEDDNLSRCDLAR